MSTNSPQRFRRSSPGDSSTQNDSLQRALDKVEASQKILCLNQDGISDAGLLAVVNMLKGNAAITTVHLEHNSITVNGARCLGTLLDNNFYLTALNLSNNAVADVGCEAIAAALPYNHSLKQLKLAWNGIGPKGMVAMAEALQHNCSLTALDVRWNQITDEGAQALETALMANDALTDVNLRWNPISDELLATVRALLNQDRYHYRAQFLAQRRLELQQRVSSPCEPDGEAEQPSFQLPPLRHVSVATLTVEHEMGPTKLEYDTVLAERMQLQATCHDLNQKVTRLEEMVSNTQAMLQEKDCRVRELEAMKESLESTFQQLKAQSEKAYSELKQVKDAALDEVKGSRDVLVQMLKEEKERDRLHYTATLEKLQATLEQERQSHAREYSELQAHCKQVEEEGRTYAAQKEGEHKRILKAAEDLHRDELRLEQQERRQEQQELQEALKALQHQHSAEKLQLSQSHAEIVDQLKCQAHAAEGKLKKLHDNEVASLHQHYEVLLEEKECQIRQKDFSLRQALEEKDQMRRDTDVELSELRHQHHMEVERLQQQEVTLTHDIEILKLQHSYALDEQAKFIEKLSDLEQLKKANEALLARQKEDHMTGAMEEKNRQLRESEAEQRRRAEEMRSLREAHDLNLALLRDDHKKHLKELQVEYEERLARTVATEGKKCEDLRRALRQLEEDLRAKHMEEQQQYVTHQLETMRGTLLQRIECDKEELLQAHAQATQELSAAWLEWVHQQQAKKAQKGCTACVIC